MGTRKLPRKMAGEDQKDEKKLVGKSGKEMDVEAKINDIMMEGGKVIKMEVDYSETVAKKIPEAKELAKKNLNEALEMLTGLEKQTRTGADMHSTAKVLVWLVSFTNRFNLFICSLFQWMFDQKEHFFFIYVFLIQVFFQSK